jgi:glycosyltransferase involved in cell wall biosynthesis
MAKVAWLIPLWKTEKAWMQTLIQSIQSQNVRDWEAHIISDGCEDTKLLWDLECLADLDPRFRIWNRKHLGLVRTLNFGLSVIDAQYILRLDADDFCVGQRIEKQIAFMDACPDISLCGGSMCDVDGRLEFKPNCPKRLGPKIFKKIIERNETLAFHPTWCIRRTQIDRYPEGYDHAEDVALLSIFILQHKQITNVPDILTAHRLHINRMSALHHDEQRANALRAIGNILGQDCDE